MALRSDVAEVGEMQYPLRQREGLATAGTGDDFDKAKRRSHNPPLLGRQCDGRRRR